MLTIMRPSSVGNARRGSGSYFCAGAVVGAAVGVGAGAGGCAGVGVGAGVGIGAGAGGGVLLGALLAGMFVPVAAVAADDAPPDIRFRMIASNRKMPKMMLV